MATKTNGSGLSGWQTAAILIPVLLAAAGSVGGAMREVFSDSEETLQEAAKLCAEKTSEKLADKFEILGGKATTAVTNSSLAYSECKDANDKLDNLEAAQ